MTGIIRRSPLLHRRASDSAALRAACADDVGLCTLVGIDGSFSRRVGAQLAVLPDGSTIGSMSDGCLERQLAADLAVARADRVSRVLRYGQGSPQIDFRLPCGGGLDILVDPRPDRDACRRAAAALDARSPARLKLAHGPLANPTWLRERRFVPELRLAAFGEGPELAALRALAEVMEIDGPLIDRRDDGARIGLGREPEMAPPDPYTAVVLLFHDHEWEAPILHWAFAGRPFFVGAQGGARVREARAPLVPALRDCVQRLVVPAGLIPRARDPSTIALSLLCEVVLEYEKLHPHASS